MVKRQNNQLPTNLPQLQNLIKRDPEAYHEEFLQQYQYFNNIVELFQLTPDQPHKALEDMVMFMAQIAQCYTQEMSSFPQKIIDILEKNNTVLDNNMRMIFCRALILLRNKNLLATTDLLELFFKLLKCNDKALRKFLQTYIVTDVKNLNLKNKNAKMNSTLQTFMYTMLNDSNKRAVKMSLDIMVELYMKNIWNDAKTVNVIAAACFSKYMKVMVAALKFFINKDKEEDNSSDSDSDEDKIDVKEALMANKIKKKTRKGEKKLKKVKKLATKTKKDKHKAPVFNFSAIQLLHDPQSMAEKLFKQLEGSTKRFEVKILTLDVISRLVGLHDLFLFNLYPYLQRFMQPHQREVTRILLFAAQASHELLPPDVLEPVLKTLANNFVTERNTSDVMAIGLNAITEICARCPLAMNYDLLSDLVQYKSYKDRSVMMAAKALINLFRGIRPEILHRNFKGRPTDAMLEMSVREYGKFDAKDFVPGAEVLLEEPSSDFEINSDSESNDDEWVDVDHSADVTEDLSDGDDEDGTDGDDENEDDDDESINDSAEEDEEVDDKNLSKSEKKDRVILKGKLRKEHEIQCKRKQAQQISIERLLNDEDFKRIDTNNVKKQISATRSGTKRKLESEPIKQNSGIVKLGDIENIFKKRKHDKNSRLQTVAEGHIDRVKFGYKDGRINENCSRTNREKSKRKNVMMVRHKARGKVKRSFKDKQVALREHLLKLRKMK